MAGIANDRVKPTTQRPRGIFSGRVVVNTRICTEHYLLTLLMPADFPASAPGQFMQLECRDHEATCDNHYQVLEWSPGQARPPMHDPDFLAGVAYLRRPFSIAGRRTLADGKQEIDIIHRVVGRGTRYLESLARDAEVSVLGPLGNGFVLPQNMDLALLVGGGVGIPPMFYLAQAVHAAGKRAVGFVGAQRKDLVPLTISPCSPAPAADGSPVLNATEFADHGFPTVISTDDGSLGYKGFVTGALAAFLEKSTQIARERTVVFCCGPTPMMKATAAVAHKYGVAAQVSLEQPMACGMGTCQSCVVRFYEDAASDEWRYKLTCTDGPVFDARQLRW